MSSKARKKGTAQRRRPRGVKKILRTIHIRIVPGFVPGESTPNCFWPASEPYSEPYKILHVLKVWKDEWFNTFYRVITDKGAFDIYRHRRITSITESTRDYIWWLERELALYDLKPHNEKRGARSMKATSQGYSPHPE